MRAINISHILITEYGFKVYRTKTLCRKNYFKILKQQGKLFSLILNLTKHMRERERERERERAITGLRL